MCKMSDNNGELTFAKAFQRIQDHDISSNELLEEYCKAVAFIEQASEDIIESMEWMTTQLKWHFRFTLGVPEDLPDSEVNYSPDMKKAMYLLKKLKTM